MKQEVLTNASPTLTSGIVMLDATMYKSVIHSNAPGDPGRMIRPRPRRAFVRLRLTGRYPFVFTNSFMNSLTCSHASIGHEL